MLIPYPELIEEFKIRPTGVLHMGAHKGQEAEQYHLCGTDRMIFIEALPDVFMALQRNIKRFPQALAINACIGPQDGQKQVFHVSSNDGESSSLFEFGTHAIVHPDVSFTHDIEVTTWRVATLIRQYAIEVKDYNFLNIDLQGAELIALKSMEDLLQDAMYVYIEVNLDYLYKNIPLRGNIDDYLVAFGFQRVKEKILEDKKWGDAFYVKNSPVDHVPA